MTELAALRGVDFSYGQLQVLFDVDLEIRQGEILGLLGTNGAGTSCSRTRTSRRSLPSSSPPATAAGPNLTRPGWAQALQRLGRFDGALSPQSLFAPGKTNGGELVHVMVWHADCTCYRQTGPLHRGVG